jgi:DNA repair exonuclease SbcCD ATPase subunit
MAEKDEIQKRIKEEIARLDKESAKAYREKLKGLNAINASLNTYQSLLNNIKDDVADIDKGFSGILSEIKAIVGELEKGNKNTRDATKAFKGLESIASKLKYDQQGYNDLNLDQLEIIIKTLKIFSILSKVKDFKALTYQILNKLFQILVYKVFQHYVGSYVDSKELFFSEKNILFYMNNVISFLNNHINDFNV